MAVTPSPTLTSTSHTLSGQLLMTSASLSGAKPASDMDMTAFLESLRPDNRHKFIEPNAAIPNESLNIVKNTLEAFASQVSDLQQQRLKESRKRKRSRDASVVGGGDVLKLRKVYVDGFETGQVWQQAKKIIRGVLGFADGLVDELEERGEVVQDGSEGEETRSLAFGEDGFEVDSDDDSDGSEENSDDGSDENEDNAIDEMEQEDEDSEGSEQDVDGDAELQDASSQSQDDEDGEEEDEDEEEADEFVQDPNGLNDGFFSIDAFNKQTQWFEDQDARGDPNTDQASDDEDVDWNADPLAPPKSSSKSSGKKGALADALGEDAEDDDDGPTFGDMDLDAPEGASDEEDIDMDDGVEDDEGNDFNANEVYYKDFFAPPPRKNKAGKPFKKRVPKSEPQRPNEDDTARAMADVKRDLFDDESDNDDDSDQELSDVSAGDPKSRRSAHERRQAKLAEEIRQLEAASVAKREWTLSGEAAAADRPLNSLLEQDLDFEHVGKPVPVITPQVSESIEDLIKRRILAQEFDEVIRRRPDTDGLPTHTRRGLIELDDSKSTKGLAEVYEEEHIKQANPDTYVSQSDAKLQKEEKEIEALWKDVSSRLDALSSWQYKPKPAAPTLSVVSDIATIAMEDAQPTTAQAVTGASSRMAPQEIYKAGTKDDVSAAAAAIPKSEVVTKAGLPLAREEMSREEKLRRRRRAKERIRKAGGAEAQRDSKKGVLGTRAKMQRDTMAELKRGGVKVINRKGEITDVDGNKAKAKKAVNGRSFKL
ncbi:hypothetical protein E4U57_006005 [Claviceps arundinis]|uniref:U3 small nucleolar ribonucleoprotein protein MPP10 n=1 Tax=Claviceps arundinis TaxID=1623583 RepID=A0ABQ7PMM8_9HYPO|nr:hypothetical protein E4U57_006005 [Claviceps arundinis]